MPSRRTLAITLGTIGATVLVAAAAVTIGVATVSAQALGEAPSPNAVAGAPALDSDPTRSPASDPAAAGPLSPAAPSPAARAAALVDRFTTTCMAERGIDWSPEIQALVDTGSEAGITAMLDRGETPIGGVNDEEFLAERRAVAAETIGWSLDDYLAYVYAYQGEDGVYTGGCLAEAEAEARAADAAVADPERDAFDAVITQCMAANGFTWNRALALAPGDGDGMYGAYGWAVGLSADERSSFVRTFVGTMPDEYTDGSPGCWDQAVAQYPEWSPLWLVPGN